MEKKAQIKLEDITVRDFFLFSESLTNDDDVIFSILAKTTGVKQEELEDLDVEMFFNLVGVVNRAMQAEIENPRLRDVVVNMSAWKIRDFRKYMAAMNKQDFETALDKLAVVTNKETDELNNMPFTYLAAVMKRVNERITKSVEQGK